LNDLPVAYSDGCHLDFASTDPPPCVYGDPSSKTTVVLIGDSHAAQWLPALQVLAQRHDWRLVSLTKSACPIASVPVWNQVLKREYRECDAWHERVLARLANERPALAVVASASGYQIVDSSGRTPVAQAMDAWHAGIVDFLGKVAQQVGRIVLLAENPHLSFDPLDCLASHASIEGCPSPRRRGGRHGLCQLRGRARERAGNQSRVTHRLAVSRRHVPAGSRQGISSTATIST